jgi:hypothetical protein
VGVGENALARPDFRQVPEVKTLRRKLHFRCASAASSAEGKSSRHCSQPIRGERAASK